jgi:transposase
VTPEERGKRARSLRAKGKTYKEIAAILEVSIATACNDIPGRISTWKRAHPDRIREYEARRAPKKRQWERDQAGDCVDCGVHLSCESSTRCAPCKNALKHKEARERTERFIELRRQGLFNYEIADREGVTSAVIATTLHRASRFGLEVPPSAYGPTAARMGRV